MTNFDTGRRATFEICEVEIQYTAPRSVVALFRETLDAYVEPGAPRWLALEHVLHHVFVSWEATRGGSNARTNRVSACRRRRVHLWEAAMRVLLVLLCFGLAACVPLADHPAGDEEHAVFDGRLQGVWRAADDDGPMLLFASAADDDGHGVHFVTVEETGNHRWKTTEYDGIATRRGRYGFLSIRYATTDGERRGWVIARYTFVGRDRLLFATLDETRLAAGVRAEKIPGRVSGDGPYADVDLTMSSIDLLAFLESKDGEKLFDPPHALTRVTTLDVRAPRAHSRRRPPAHQSSGGGGAPTPSR